MVATTFDPKTAVFTPADTSAIGIQRIQEMEASKHRAMPLPIPKIGDYLAHLMPGEICAIQAQTSNYKSGFINMWENSLANYLQTSDRADEIIIHIDTETSIDTLAIQEIARRSNHTIADLSRGNVRDWPNVMKAAIKLGTVPVFRIAAGAADSDDAMADLHLSNIYRAVRHMVNGELLGRPLKPACIFIDYLQALPIDPEVKQVKVNEQRRLQVRQDVYRIRQMTRFTDCPIVVGVQAKQEMKGHGGSNMMIPGTYDGEETSSIAQRFDRIISLWMPKTTHNIGEELNHKGNRFEVTDDLIWIKVNKQRGGLPAGATWKCQIDYATNTITPI